MHFYSVHQSTCISCQCWAGHFRGLKCGQFKTGFSNLISYVLRCFFSDTDVLKVFWHLNLVRLAYDFGYKFRTFVQLRILERRGIQTDFIIICQKLIGLYSLECPRLWRIMDLSLVVNKQDQRTMKTAIKIFLALLINH